ncbi:hypothetical protein FRB93_004021 [Tulasnella sp. JGI-2019a]|nr:hypothetical protein FRB93_004021 [Tulasnella sp. JGI-2019a]
MNLQTSAPLATSLIAFCIYTTTFPAYRMSLRWLRLVLAFPITALTFAAAYPPNLPEQSQPGAYIQTFIFSNYLFMRAMDCCIVGFWDGDGGRQAVPRWQKRAVKKDGGDSDDKTKFSKLPLPTTWQGRLAYTVDSLISFRGSSVFRDCSWDWAPRAIREYHSSSRAAYFRTALGNLLFAYCILDIVESIMVNHRWNLTTPYPVTSLPILQQIFFTPLQAVFTFTGNIFAFEQPWGMILVIMFRLPPNSCPPLHLFNPLTAESLAELWGSKWHTLWRRTFDRMSLPAVWAMERLGGDRPFSIRTIKFVRAFVIFGLSALLHIGVTFTVPGSPPAGRSAANLAWVVIFFLAQPFGMLFENMVVHPLTETLPGRWKGLIRRAFVWAWMIWTGRWIANWFVLLSGFQRRSIDFSLVALVLEKLGY